MPARTLALLLVALASGLPAWAADKPPPWRGQPLTTHQEWTFSTPPPNYPNAIGGLDTEAQPPDASSNPYPLPGDRFTGFGARGLQPPVMGWEPGIFGAQGVWRLAPVEWKQVPGTFWGWLQGDMANAGLAGHRKEVRVQVTTKNVTGPPEVGLVGSAPDPQQEIAAAFSQVHPDLPNGWQHRTFIFLLPDCPPYESVAIYPPNGGLTTDNPPKGGVIYVDHVVIDTICRPVDDQEGSQLGLPGGDEEYGLHLAPGADTAAVLEAHGATALTSRPLGERGTLLLIRAPPAARTALARDARVLAVAPDFCREMQQGPGVSVATGDDKKCDETQTVVGGTTVQGSGQSNDPVNTYTGALFFHEPPDLELGGPLPLTFQRYYASGLDGPLPVTAVARAGAPGAAATVVAGPVATPEAFLAGATPAWDGRPLGLAPAAAGGRVGPLAVAPAPTGRLGANWRHRFDWTLQRVGAHALVLTPEGRAFAFWRGRGGWRQGSGLDTPAQLVETGSSLVFAFRAGGLRHVFDRAGRLARIEDGYGSALTLGWDGGRLVEVADGLGRRLGLAYDPEGRLVEVGDGTRVVRFGHTGRLLTQVTDALGAVTRYRYEDRPARPGLLVAVTRPNGNTPYTQSYDAEGRVASQTDAAGHTTRFAYAAGVTTITDPAGRTVRHAHDAAGRLVAVTDETGQRFTLSYDAAGRRSGLTDRLGDSTRAGYHERSGAPASIAQADGATTTFEYAARRTGGVEAHDLVRVTRPDGRAGQVAHDAAGNLISSTDAAGNTWRYAYDARGRLVAATDPTGAVTRYAYHPDGTLASLTDAAGQVTAYEYDALRRLVRVRLPDGASLGYAYDARDRLVTLTDEGGQTWRSGYDPNGNLTSLTDPLGAVTRFAYDAMDRVEEVTGPEGGRDRLAFSERGHVRTWTLPAGGTVGYEYDARGRLTAIVGPDGRRFTRQRDAEGVMTAATDPLGSTRRYESDRLGRLTRLTGRDGHAVELGYDRLGRLVSATDALGQTTTRTYDARGLLAGISVGTGALATRYERDAAGRLAAIVDPAGQRWERTYDAQGRLGGARDPLGRAIGYAHDARGRIAAIDLPGGLGRVALAHDATGRLVSRRDPDGSERRYEYDAAGRLVRADGLALRYDAGGRLVESNGLALAHDAAGNLTRLTLAPGKTVDYGYDRAGRLTEVRDWLGGQTTFAYDAAGRLVRLTRPNGVTTNFAHDPEGRLVGIEHGRLGQVTLTRDAAGRVTAADRKLPLAAAAPAGQRRLAFDAAAQVAGFSYDALGRLTKDDRRSYEWDAASRLVRYTEGGRPVSFTYDALGQRLARRGDGAAREYAWNYGFALPAIAVEREAGADRAYYVHAPDGTLLYRVDARDGSRRFHHFDEIGNATFLTDDRGGVTAAYAYTAYGALLGARDDPDNPFTWGGQRGVVREGLGGLYYLRARWYDAASGRFLSRDPRPGFGPRTVNPYQYARGNPLHYVDPTGSQSTPAGDRAPAGPRPPVTPAQPTPPTGAAPSGGAPPEPPPPDDKPATPASSPEPPPNCAESQREAPQKFRLGFTIRVEFPKSIGGIYLPLDLWPPPPAAPPATAPAPSPTPATAPPKTGAVGTETAPPAEKTNLDREDRRRRARHRAGPPSRHGPPSPDPCLYPDEETTPEDIMDEVEECLVRC